MLAYIDPNQLGLPVQTMAPWLAAMLGAGCTALLMGWRWVLLILSAITDVIYRQRLWIGGALSIGLIGAGIYAARVSPSQQEADASQTIMPHESAGGPVLEADPGQKVLILGIDGLDPDLTTAMMAAGELPNFQRLQAAGAYRPLATVTPPESPVVWSSFSTGLHPAGHGIFDFIHRDPSDYSLDLSITQPKSSGGYVNPRGGVTFWEKLSDAGVPVRVLFPPCSFPPEEVRGVLLSGMGTPDLQGHMGRYTLISTDPTWAEKKLAGRLIGVARSGDRLAVELPGPRLASGGVWPSGRPRELTIPLRIERDRDNGSVRLIVQDQALRLSAGEWSPWVRLTFKRKLHSDIRGICRFYLVSQDPDLNLYCTPIQFDPVIPVFDISYPGGFAKELAEEVGLYATLGMPLDTKAYEDDVLDAAGFLGMAESIIEEQDRILGHVMNDWDRGLLFFYFNTPDPVQHMFWQDFVKQRLAEQGVSAIPQPIRDCYRRMDGILGEVLDRLDDEPDTQVMVLSDHGFADFRRAVEVNRVLAELGYLTLKPGAAAGKLLFQDVDWSRTRAYACGFTSIYLNLVGRERSGAVPLDQRDAVLAQLRQDLLDLTDPATGEQVFRSVTERPYSPDAIYASRSPDLVLGCAPGYRVSWVTALGGVSEAPIEANTKKWRGDHIIHADAVPGILLVRHNRGILPETIQSVGDYVLDQFNTRAVSVTTAQVR